MKLLSLLTLSYLLTLPTVVFAQTEDYVPLIGIPGVEPGSGIEPYLNALYVLAISIAALLAVARLMWAGLQYILSDIVTTKENAKKEIRNTLIGLLIVISAVFVLNIINPSLTNLSALSGITGVSFTEQRRAEVVGITAEFDPESLGTTINWDDATDAQRSQFRDNCTGDVNTTRNNAGTLIGTCVVDVTAPVDPDLNANTNFSTNINELLPAFENYKDRIGTAVGGANLGSGDLRGFVSLDEIPGDDDMAMTFNLQPACEAIGGSHIGYVFTGTHDFWCVGNVRN